MGIRIFAVAQMGNHAHLELEDRHGELSDFMMIFLGRLGKSLNRLDGVRGQVFERRFDAIPIVDDEALIERIAYCVANPARADLVSTYSAWTGVCAYGRADRPTKIATENFRRREYERALRRARAKRTSVDRESFTDRLELTLVSCGFDEEVREAVAEREAEAAAARGAKRVLGSKRAARMHPFGAPSKSKRARRPLCHASSAAARLVFRETWCVFVDAYRQASAAFRAGDLQASFPKYSFRPWIPVIDIR